MVDADSVAVIIGDDVAVGFEGQGTDVVGVDVVGEGSQAGGDGVFVDVDSVEQAMQDHEVAGDGDGQLADDGQGFVLGM